MKDRPDYADFDAPAKFLAIESIIAKRLREHPKAICSYSGGADSDIMLDMIERVRKIFKMPPVAYEFINTGLEMQATKGHVEEQAEKYGVEITEIRPKMNIVRSTRQYGVPFLDKLTSARISQWQESKNFDLGAVKREYDNADDKPAIIKEQQDRYPGRKTLLKWVCGYDGKWQKGTNSQFYADPMLLDFLCENPPDFKVSAKCCDFCKKQPAHEAQKGFDMIITGERKAEGGIRSVGRNTQGCFSEYGDNQYRLRPLYYVTNNDKAWYKQYHGLKYSDAYEVYGFTRTGCCGCPINYKATEYLERLRPYEPNVVKAAWNIFGKSYEYRRKYNEYKAERRAREKRG